MATTNRLVGVLAFSTLAFAGSTLYLANELRVEEKRAAQTVARVAVISGQQQFSQSQSREAREAPQLSQAVQPVQRSAQADPRSAFPDSPSAQPDLRAEPVAASESGSASVASASAPSASDRERERRARVRARQQESYAKLLKQYEDPAGRARLLADARAERLKNLGRFPKVASLTEDETQRLVDALAVQQVEGNVNVARCGLDPACAGSPQEALKVIDKDVNRRRLVDVLGLEKVERYEAFQGSIGERRGVTALRARLPDDHMLADADAERLIEALARERQKFVSEVEQRGGVTRSFSLGGNASLFYRVDANAQSSQNRRVSPDLDSAIDFAERMKKSASQVLTTEQMRTFTEMQDDLISVLRQRQRNEQMRPGRP